MRCQKCGMENEQGNRFCGGCGSELIQPINGTTTESWDIYPNPNYNYKRINGKVYVIVSAISLIFGLLLGIIALVNAVEINKLQDMGEYEAARKKAKICLIMWVVTAAFNLLMIIGYLAENGAI